MTKSQWQGAQWQGAQWQGVESWVLIIGMRGGVGDATHMDGWRERIWVA